MNKERACFVGALLLVIAVWFYREYQFRKVTNTFLNRMTEGKQ